MPKLRVAFTRSIRCCPLCKRKIHSYKSGNSLVIVCSKPHTFIVRQQELRGEITLKNRKKLYCYALHGEINAT